MSATVWCTSPTKPRNAFARSAVNRYPSVGGPAIAGPKVRGAWTIPTPYVVDYVFHRIRWELNHRHKGFIWNGQLKNLKLRGTIGSEFLSNICLKSFLSRLVVTCMIRLFIGLFTTLLGTMTTWTIIFCRKRNGVDHYNRLSNHGGNMTWIQTSDKTPPEGKVVFTRLPFNPRLPGKVSYDVMYYRNNMWYLAGGTRYGEYLWHNKHRLGVA